MCYFEYGFSKNFDPHRRLWVDLEGEKSCDQHFVPCLRSSVGAVGAARRRGREVAACLAAEETVKINEKLYTLCM
jgi:hypothetical protein